MRTGDFPVHLKGVGAKSGLAEGQVSAVVSVFGNVDSVGDMVMPGAFKASLAEWDAKGDRIPFLWSHEWADPFSHLGSIVEARETTKGLEVLAQLEDLEDNPKAAQVWRLLKGRRVTQMSFAYDIEEGVWADHGGRKVYELRKLRIHEAGPCLIGANQATELLGAKGRPRSAPLRRLEAAQRLYGL